MCKFFDKPNLIFFKLKNSSSSAFFGKNFCWQGECLSFWAYGATSYFIFVEFAKTDKIDPPYFKVYHLLCSVHYFPPTQPKEISLVRVLQPPFDVLNCSTIFVRCQIEQKRRCHEIEPFFSK